MFLHPGRQCLGEFAELTIAEEPAFNEPVNLVRRDSWVLLDLIQDLKGDFTASGSSRHDRLALPLRRMRQRFQPRVFQIRSTAPIIRQGRLNRKGGRIERPLSGSFWAWRNCHLSMLAHPVREFAIP